MNWFSHWDEDFQDINVSLKNEVECFRIPTKEEIEAVFDCGSKTKYNNQFVQMDEQEYIRYKLCCYYYAETEMYDRTLTNLRSPYDLTEAYVADPMTSHFSNRYALGLKKYLQDIANYYGVKFKINEFNHLYYSAQRWIDEYDRLMARGEMNFIKEFRGERS